MPTQKQYDTTLQRIRQIDCKITVLNNNYIILDEISGLVVNINIDISADSDIRRTANIQINLKDDISIKQSHDFYWTAGNSYWFDKYIQIYTSIKDVQTEDDVWVNQGIYCVNAPSISYDAISNILSFQAVDLISKMTGMRNGQLQGQTTTIPVGSSIKNAIETILLEQGFTNYILYDPPQILTPDDINIDAGGTAWDLLTQLRDINSNWEMFFDVDGVFHFQEIPSGKVIISQDSMGGEFIYTYGNPVPVADNTLLDKIVINASYDTNFEDVKNYIEVYGKTHEPSEFVDGTISGQYLGLILNHEKSYYLNGTHIIEFGLGDVTLEPQILATPIEYILIYDKEHPTVLWKEIDISDTPITLDNQFYCISWTVASIETNAQGTYLGYIQSNAWAIDNNPESPFYVGQMIEYTCKINNAVDFVSEKEIVTADDVNSIVSGGVATIDLRPWISASDYSSALVNYEWKFKVHIQSTYTTPVTNLLIRYAGSQTLNIGARGLNNQQISLDYDQDYMVIIQKTNSTPNCYVAYYPTEASQIQSSGTDIFNLPKFTNQIRLVCSGGEYDNIYSNSLAVQRARYEIYLRARLHDNISIQCVPIYWLDVNQIIEYRLPNSATKESDYWLVKSISTDVSVEGTQTINAMRYYPEYAQI